MVNSIGIFEDSQYKNLFPLTYFRPVYDLRCGILSLREKILKTFPNQLVSLFCRDYLSEIVKQNNPDVLVNEHNSNSILLINGSVICDDNLHAKIELGGEDKVYVNNGIVVAVKLSNDNLERLRESEEYDFDISNFQDLPKVSINVRMIKYPWDLVRYNGDELISDFNLLTKERKIIPNTKIYDGVHLLNRENIFIDNGTVIKPGVVLDAEDGPIYIGKNVKILSNAIIQGPAYIGDYSLVKMNATLYHNSNIGKVCKVGGEIEDTIIHSYSNKQHEGFLGHSYLGSWINLGASTNNSDLKNNYGNIKVYINGEPVDSGLQFVGLTMGDHSKSAINTMFNTGTVVGVSCNIFGAGFPPNYMPSFSWGGSESVTTYKLDKSLEVAQKAMSRRNRKMTDADIKLFKHVYDLTGSERS